MGVNLQCCDPVSVVLQADVVFLSPPWGGPAYQHDGIFDVSLPLGQTNRNLAAMLDTARQALRDPEAGRIGAFLPRTTGLASLTQAVPGQALEVERSLINGFFKAITAYFGALASNGPDPHGG